MQALLNSKGSDPLTTIRSRTFNLCITLSCFGADRLWWCCSGFHCSCWLLLCFALRLAKEFVALNVTPQPWLTFSKFHGRLGFFDLRSGCLPYLVSPSFHFIFRGRHSRSIRTWPEKISLINITNKNNQPHHRWYVWLVLCSFLWASSQYTCMHACVYVLVCYTTLTSWTLKRTWSQACIARQCLPRTLELPGPQTSLHQVEHALPSLLLGLSSQQKIFGD